MYHWTARIECPNCYTGHDVEVGEDGCASFERDWRCQGATPDLCVTEGCEQCKVVCVECALPVCEAHRRIVKGELLCDNCRIERELEDAEERASELRVEQTIRRVTEEVA